MSENVNLSFGDTMLLAANTAASAAAAEASNRAAHEIAAQRRIMEESRSAIDTVYQCKIWLESKAQTNQPLFIRATIAKDMLQTLESITTISLPTIADKELRQSLMNKLETIVVQVSSHDINETKWMLSYTPAQHWELRKKVVYAKLLGENGRFRRKAQRKATIEVSHLCKLTFFIVVFGGGWLVEKHLLFLKSHMTSLQFVIFSVVIVALPLIYTLLTLPFLPEIPFSASEKNILSKYSVDESEADSLFKELNKESSFDSRLDNLNQTYEYNTKRYNQAYQLVFGDNFKDAKA
jgi:hypothetical protein